MRLRIKRWQEVFEQVGTTQRPKKSMRWFTRPCDKAHGVGSMALRSHPKGQMFRGIFDCCLEVSALLPVEMRGLVVRDDGTPHTAETLHIIHGGATVEDYREAIAFFLQPVIGWLIDEEAQQVGAQPSKVVAMPLPKIEEPSIYEVAAEGLLRLYRDAEAPLSKLMSMEEVSRALMARLEGTKSAAHPDCLELITENVGLMLSESRDLSKILRLDNFIRSGPCLAPRKGPKYKRGSVEALILTEVRAGRMTQEQAKEQGIQV